MRFYFSYTLVSLFINFAAPRSFTNIHIRDYRSKGRPEFVTQYRNNASAILIFIFELRVGLDEHRICARKLLALMLNLSIRFFVLLRPLCHLFLKGVVKSVELR